MKRPEVCLENHTAVYEFYRTHQQPKSVARIAYAALDFVYRPHVHMSEQTRDDLIRYKQENTSLLLPINHISNTHDQYVASAVAHQIIPEAIGRTRVLAKDELFRTRFPPRVLVDSLGAVPVFRRKNYTDQEALRAQATESLFDAMAERLVAGDNLALYPEGTHNRDNPLLLSPLQQGMGKIGVRAAAQSASVAVVPIGTNSGSEPKAKNHRSASVVVGNTFVIEPGMTSEEVTARTALELQAAVDEAYERYSHAA